jgi:class 3 adenylate cyclase
MPVPRTKYVRNGDVSIAYQVYGEGDLDLLYVPGVNTQLELTWEEPSITKYYERLGSFARVIRMDKRGTGLSDRIVGAATLEDRMDDVRVVMDAVGSERAVIYGVSEGGPMAMLFAATYPERVIALILYATMVKFVRSDDFPWAPSVETLDAVVAHGQKHFGDGAGMPFWAPSVGDDPAIREWWGRAERLSGSPGSDRAMHMMNRELDVRAALPAITAPTLVLHRTGDRLVDVNQARYIAANVHGAKLIELVGNDHLPYYEGRDALVNEIELFLTGTHKQIDADRILATVLFTDIVGSTTTAGDMGDARWRDVLERHNEVVQKSADRHRGRVVKSTGDGHVFLFDGPARAVRCAFEIGKGVGHLGIDVRAGAHTGEVELLGDDIGGLAVHIAQRVSSHADGGEVLVSRTVKDLVAGSGLAFESRGEYELKGIPEVWELFAASESS